jgi:hypothetical protein
VRWSHPWLKGATVNFQSHFCCSSHLNSPPSTEIHCRGVPQSQGKDIELSELLVEQLHKWIHGNEVWALAVNETIPDDTTNTTSALAPDLQALLHEYADVLFDCQTLSPQRTLDHAISLEDGATPVNSRPYRYSPLEKDEIECQVQEMLAAGVIVHSMSLFASSVLLVKKKDGS